PLERFQDEALEIAEAVIADAGDLACERLALVRPWGARGAGAAAAGTAAWPPAAGTAARASAPGAAPGTAARAARSGNAADRGGLDRNRIAAERGHPTGNDAEISVDHGIPAIMMRDRFADPLQHREPEFLARQERRLRPDRNGQLEGADHLPPPHLHSGLRRRRRMGAPAP